MPSIITQERETVNHTQEFYAVYISLRKLANFLKNSAVAEITVFEVSSENYGSAWNCIL